LLFRLLPAVGGSWVEPCDDASQHVNFVDIDEHLHEMYIKPGFGHWEDNDLTAFAGSTGLPPALRTVGSTHLPR